MSEVPDGVHAPTQYGPGVRGVATYLCGAQICLVDEPAVPRGAPAGRVVSTSSGVNRTTQRKNCCVVNLDAAFGQQLRDVTVGQPEPQVPADGQRDDSWREAEPGELGTCCGDPKC